MPKPVYHLSERRIWPHHTFLFFLSKTKNNAVTWMLRQTRGACKQALIQSQRLFGCPAWIQIRRNTFPVSISSLAFTAQLIHQESGEAESSCSAGLTPTHLDLLDRFASLDVNPDKQRGGELEQRLSFIPPYLPDTQSRYLSSGAGAGWGGWFLSDTWHMVLTGPNTLPAQC